MAQVIVYKTPDGQDIYVGVSADADVAAIVAEVVPADREYAVIDEVDLPDPAFRAAWRLVNGQVVVDAARQAAVQQEAIAAITVSPRQIRLALHHMGLLGAVKQWIAAASEDVQIEWEFAESIYRSHPMWVAGAAALGKTSADIDQLFLVAATL